MNDLWDSTDLPADLVTPTLRRLKREGIELTNYYGQAYCTPARVALLTGRFPHRSGFSYPPTFEFGDVEIVVDSNYSIPLSDQYHLLPEHLRRLGYRTHGVGKWNVGHCHEAYLPWRRGFDTFMGYFGDGIDYVDHASDFSSTIDLFGDEAVLVDFVEYSTQIDWAAGLKYAGEHTTTLFTRAARRRLEEESASYVWLSYHGVHDNAQSLDTLDYNESLWEALSARFGYTARRRAFGINAQAIDSGVADLLSVLEAKDESFVVVFHSDNGGAPCAQHLCGNNLPARGGKFSDFEGALRVPAFVYAPGLLASHRAYDGLMHHVDWLATLVTVAGGSLDDDYDSLDHWHALRSDSRSPRDACFFSITATSLSLRVKDLKLIHGYTNATWLSTSTNVSEEQDCYFGANPANFLFNITSDPTETRNLYYDRDYSDLRDHLIRLGHEKHDAESVQFARGRLLADDPPAAAALKTAWLRSTDDPTVKVVTPWACETIKAL